MTGGIYRGAPACAPGSTYPHVIRLTCVSASLLPYAKGGICCPMQRAGFTALCEGRTHRSAPTFRILFKQLPTPFVNAEGLDSRGDAASAAGGIYPGTLLAIKNKSSCPLTAGRITNSSVAGSGFNWYCSSGPGPQLLLPRPPCATSMSSVMNSCRSSS